MRRGKRAEWEEGGEIREDAESGVIRRCRSRTFDALLCLISNMLFPKTCEPLALKLSIPVLSVPVHSVPVI
jgi:hypothetical protein